LRETGVRRKAKLDVAGNVTFAVGMVSILIGITYGLQPYGGRNMGWTNPWVLTALIGGLAMLVVFWIIENHVEEPMFNIGLFRIRAFSAGNLAGLLMSIGRGGLQFMLITWLQGIWLPLHGYNFVDTPLWAGIFMLPLTAGFLIAGPTAGWLSDRYGARPFATGGALLCALSFGLLMLLPANFSFPVFGALLLMNGLGVGMFAAPNTTGIMNSVPNSQRGVASGMRATFQNTGMVLSIGLFFSLMVVGLSSTLPQSMSSGLIANGVPADTAHEVASAPPVGSLFAAFLGYNPMEKLVPADTLRSLTQEQSTTITGKHFFPGLISEPFKNGLKIAFTASMIMCIIAAIASWMRGKKYVHDDEATTAALAHAEEVPQEWVPA